VLPEDLPAIVAGLTENELQQSQWLMTANLTIALREQKMMDMVEYLWNDPCNTYVFGLRRKFSRQKLLEIVLDCGEDAAERVAFLPPEGGSLYWHRISRNSRAYREQRAKDKAKAKAEAQAQAEA
jgi:hypothetical protein